MYSERLGDLGASALSVFGDCAKLKLNGKSLSKSSSLSSSDSIGFKWIGDMGLLSSNSYLCRLLFIFGERGIVTAREIEREEKKDLKKEIGAAAITGS
jgi:hypothetical protein